MRAYGEKQLYENGFYGDDYAFIEEEGTFPAVLDYKRWGNRQNLLAYFTLEDGRKVIASAWKNAEYLGIPEIPIGAPVTLFFKETMGGRVFLRGVKDER